MVSKTSMRYCPKCDHETARNKRGDCKPCANNRAAAYYLHNKEHVISQVAQYRARNAKKIAARRAVYRQSNKELIALKKAAYFVANRSRLYEKHAAWKASNRARWATYQARYYRNHLKKCADKSAAWRNANRDRHAALVRTWAAKNPWRLTVNDARRRAIKKQATPLWGDQEKIEEFYYTANMLGMHTGDFYHVDHVVPLQSDLVCGLHCQQNLQILTAAANKIKSNLVWPDMPSDYVGGDVWARW